MNDYQAKLPEEPVRSSHRNSTASALSFETAAAPEPTFYPLEQHLLHPQLLAALLPYLTFTELLPLFSLGAETRRAMEAMHEVKEAILERFLTPSVGYRRWFPERMGNKREPLSLTLRVRVSVGW